MISTPEHVLIVSTSPRPTEFASVAAALAAVTDPGPNHRYVIQVVPGIYTEPICSVPNYVYIVGEHIDGVIVQPDANNHHVFDLSNRSGLVNLTIRNAGTGYAGLNVANVGDFALIHKVTITNCHTGVLASASTIDSNMFLEYIDFSDCDTNIKITSSGAFTMFLSSENLYLQNSVAPSIASVIIDGDSSEMNIQGCSAVGPEDGTAFLITNGGYLNFSSGRIEDWEIGFYVDNNGANPYLKIQAIDFDDNLWDFRVESDTCVGYFQGESDYSKCFINRNSDFFIANEDSNIITVAKKGGNFTSVQAAVASILDATTSNKYLVKIGPGTFTEDTIITKDNVYIDGSQRFATEIKLADTSSTLFDTSAKTCISNTIIKSNTSRQCPITYRGGLFRLVAVRFYGTTLAIDATSVTGASTNSMQLNDCTVGPGETIDMFVDISSVSGDKPISVTFNNISLSDGAVTNFIRARGNKTNLRLTNTRSVQSTLQNGACLDIANGVVLQSTSTMIIRYATALSAPDVGDAPDLQMVGVLFELNTTDVNIAHANAIGTLSGIMSRAKITTQSDNVVFNITDPTDGSLTITGDYYQGGSFNTNTNYTPLFTKSLPTGIIYGGGLSTSGMDVIVEAGYGYLTQGDEPNQYCQYVSWTGDTVTLPDSFRGYYIYVNDTNNDGIGALNYAEALPDIFKTIILGRVITKSNSTAFVQETGVESSSFARKIERTLTGGLGAIYASGSQVIDAGVLRGATARSLDVSDGRYYYGTHEFTPAGGSGITWTAWYHQTVGATTSWVTTPQSVIDNAHFDSGATGLTGMTGTNFIKHSLRIANDGQNETYQLVYGQTQYGTLEAAEAGALPTPPSFWSGNLVRIASVIVQKDGANIAEIRDERPRLDFVSSAVETTNLHGNLLGLDADDHPQYLLISGSRNMSGALNLGGNNITNVGTVDSVDISDHSTRHQPNSGSDALDTAAPDTSLSVSTIGSTGVSAYFSRSDHTHAIITATANTPSTIVARSSTGAFSAGTITANLIGDVTGNVSGTSANVTGTVAIANGGTNSTTALNNNRVIVSNAGAIQEAAAITANRALISNANGIPTHALVSDTELGYLAGATGPLQTQIATKATKVTSAVANNFASLTAAGELADSGKKDSDYVHVTGDETIAGNKTFSNQISVNQRILYPIVALSLTSTAGTNNNLTLPEGVFFRIDNATGNFSITGLTGGVDGRMIILFSPNTAGYRLTIANENASSTAGNRIWTCTNADLQTGAGANSRGTFTLIYSGTDSRWIVTSYVL